MTPRSRWFYVAITLLVLSVVGIWNGYDEWVTVQTPGQRLATFTEIGYGILGPICAIAISWAGVHRKCCWCSGPSASPSLPALLRWLGRRAALGGQSRGHQWRHWVGLLVMWMSRQEKRAEPHAK
jgi:hypothetical protein